MRVEQQSAFVLQARDYRETSLLLEVFTREHGRLGLIAKGAKRAKSPFRGLLAPFQPLRIGWSGKGELGVVTGVEAVSSTLPLAGDRIFFAFYLNELVLRLLHRHDAHQKLFDDYCLSLEGLLVDSGWESILRIFEKRLLAELGYALLLDKTGVRDGELDADTLYRYIPDQGPVPVNGQESQGILLHGSTLKALAAESLQDDESLREAKQLMRSILGIYLNGKPLHSRRLYQQIIAFRNSVAV
ncbi:MAG TPA: DNA repair protein RecO [Acidiferrobacteraceae bacterium]|nr:DNA repair protein RecO [Acidiferrobacteraceae bacterium]